MHALSILLAAGLARAATIKVEAGAFYFKPEYIVADPGDVLEFHFLPKNHSVAQGDFSSPCQPAKTGGFFSGYFPVEQGEAPRVFRYTIPDRKPIWFYCTNDNRNHCREGMVGVVNAPPDATLAEYKLEAERFSGHAGQPPQVRGGEVAPNPDAGAAAAVGYGGVPIVPGGAASASPSGIGADGTPMLPAGPVPAGAMTSIGSLAGGADGSKLVVSIGLAGRGAAVPAAGLGLGLALAAAVLPILVS